MARLITSYVSESITESLRELSKSKTVCNAGYHCRCWRQNPIVFAEGRLVEW